MSRTRKPKEKSPSEKLRGVFYQHYVKDSPFRVTFDEYYEQKMSLLIDHYKSKL